MSLAAGIRHVGGSFYTKPGEKIPLELVRFPGSSFGSLALPLVGLNARQAELGIRG